ncbi:ATP-binding cassette domain-containing protein [Pseudonocardia acidicola]|uniref:ATP-binding cassette domain-containing protein n=1 Tax=Pseudonocardia acidicola TaxID=2724939 RepID=A0ABX1SHH6_9PSEU|nr:ATP-binding cassette domain-containing protein [Pseudonocardia acidicola]NMI01021.1 ATP-binding cassette domain-containing protein [Pseudonocardia acidicola]
MTHPRPARGPTPEAGAGARPIIEVDGLAKRFGEFEAVAGVGFTVGAGETFGFLGPNGAGKSTTINMLCTLLRPTAGWARVAGFDVAAQPAQVRRRIGLVFQDSTLDTYLTAAENLRFHAELYGLHRADYRRRSAQLLEMVELWDRRDELVRTFSGGMRRRLEIARGLLHAPRVLFLDEPTLGLDPQTRAHIWSYLEQLRTAEGTTVFLTTHHLDEAENCDRVAIIDHGRIVVDDPPDVLRARVGRDRMVLRTADDTAAAVALRDRFGIDAVTANGALRFGVADGESFVPDLVTGLGVRVLAVRTERPTLDDVFMTYTGRSMRDAHTGATEQRRTFARMRR